MTCISIKLKSNGEVLPYRMDRSRGLEAVFEGGALLAYRRCAPCICAWRPARKEPRCIEVADALNEDGFATYDFMEDDEDEEEEL